MRPGDMATITPAGNSIGLRPILLIALSRDAFASANASPNERNHFAAHAALGGLAMRNDSDGRRHDGGAEPAEDARQPILTRVDSAAGLGHALEVGDDAAPVTRELELDDEHPVRKRLALVVRGLDDAEVLDVALVLQDARDLLLDVG